MFDTDVKSALQKRILLGSTYSSIITLSYYLSEKNNGHLMLSNLTFPPKKIKTDYSQLY